ncbi:MAG: hypothetical protein ABI854_07340 [Betaproteobacteria bacterium]
MKDLRNLLLDCRAALRRADRDFEETELRERLDETLLEIGKQNEEEPEELGEPETFAAQQVAFAWQIATRTLRLTHPDLHTKLVDRVHDMLDADKLHDPATEILELQERLETSAAAHQAELDELAALRSALATAVPLSGRDAIGSEGEIARRRLDRLVQAAVSGGFKAEPASDDPIDHAHTREELQAVVQGKRPLSRWERGWCIAEALVTTDFSAARLQILGDAELAKLVMSGPASTL